MADVAETYRAQWEALRDSAYGDDGKCRDDQTKLGLVVAMENADCTCWEADQGTDSELWYETALRTFRDWLDCPWM